MFLKTCDFDIQILIQSKKESLSKNFLILDKKSQNENSKIKELCNSYKDFLTEKNLENDSASKDFFMIIKQDVNKSQKDDEKALNNSIAENKINEKFFKIKESLSRCGNIVFEINEKAETVEVLKNFMKANLNEKEE